MKTVLFLLIFAFSWVPAQDVEDLQEGFFYAENSRNFFRVEIARPFGLYKPESCSDLSKFTRAQFEGGDEAFSRELFKYISAYVDREIYVVNGPFFLHVSINSKGDVENLEVTPKVPNSQSFIRDLKFAVTRIKKRWSPAVCNEVPVSSKIRIKLNFTSESVDL